MASCEQNLYEGIFSSYKISSRLNQSQLTIGAEHRQTKKVYRTEINHDDIKTITKDACETCEHLFELLQELIDNNGTCTNKSLKVTERETKLVFYLTINVVFGRTSRQFSIQFELDSVQLDDITRLENIINEHAQRLEQLEWNANDRFDRATKLTSLWTNECQFRNISLADRAILSDKARTICCKTHVKNQTSQSTFAFGSTHTTSSLTSGTSTTTVPTSSMQVTVVTNQSFLLSNNKRYQLIRFNLHFSGSFNNDLIFIGVVYQPDDKEWSKIMSSDDAWLLDVCTGSIQHSYFGTRPYTWPMKSFFQQPDKQLSSTSHVDLLFDTYCRRVAFRVNDQPEGQWAFHLPKKLQIDQLYPLIILDSPNISVSIDV